MGVMKRAALVIAVVLVAAACSSDGRDDAVIAPATAPLPITASVQEGGEITMPNQPADVKPLVAACLAEASSVDVTLNFGEGCHEAALAADHAGLAGIAADLREMMTTADSAARHVIIERIERALATL